MPHPLELPEIVHLVGAYLGAKDLINCTCVSREWNSTFSTLIWQHLILINCGSSQEPCPNLTIAQIQAHASDIRCLTLKSQLPDEYYLLKNLCRLHSICVEYRTFARPRPTLPLPADLIENYSTSLRRLEIHGWPYCLELRTFEAIGMCHQLKSLSLNRVSVTGEGFTALLVACAYVGHVTGEEVGTDAMPKGRTGGLTTLCLESFDAGLSEMVPFSTLAPLSFLEHLRIGNVLDMVSEAQLKLLMLCPNLRSLYWRRYEHAYQFPMDEWVEHIESGKWPLLTSLEVSGEEFHDNGLSRFIKSQLLPLEKFLVRRTGFGPMAYNSLISTERHYNHIQELEIYECENEASHMIQKFMTKMPALRYLSAGRLRATDILGDPGKDPNCDDHGQEWICKNIRTLRLCIDMGLEFDPKSSEYAERQRHVYRRLSELKFLEILDVGRNLGPHSWREEARRLDLRLSAGLGQLASLKRIREVLFDPGQSLALKDIKWMMSIWESLEVISHLNRVISRKNERE